MSVASIATKPRVVAALAPAARPLVNTGAGRPTGLCLLHRATTRNDTPQVGELAVPFHNWAIYVESDLVHSPGCGYGLAMLLTPRYDGPAVLRFSGPVGDPSVPLLRQRRRLGELLSSLGNAQWATASRCAGWSVRDVIAHLVGTDQFWVLSATAALAGAPTRYLTGFDPVVTPALMVDGMQDLAPAEVLASYLEGVEALAVAVTGLDEARWSVPAEAPPGHVPLHALARHALWDAWIHERDVVLPLGMAPVEEHDEVLACLHYVAGLGPAFLATSGSGRWGALSLDGIDPDAHVVVEAGETVVVRDGEAPASAVRLKGRSVDLVEALSFRAPLPHDIADGDRWLLGGLATVFDLVPQR